MVAQHQGTFKWYNRKSGYGFIRDSVVNKDFFVHYSGLKRSFRKALPREGDNATFTSFKGKKGPEAREVTRDGKQERPPPRLKSSPMAGKAAEAEFRMKACICTAQVLAGNNTRRLQTLIPLLLKHNGLPTISIPEEAFTTTRHRAQKTQRRRQPPKEEPCHEEHLPHHTTASPSPAPKEGRQTDMKTTTKNISQWQWDTFFDQEDAPPTKNYFPSCEKLIDDMLKSSTKTSDSSDNEQKSKKKRHQRR
ncbi:uncharacterized protein LOC123500719 [Portunus trituberculatus]|uniref:uncharacterized protein LOC123500719 n=1 Tax=Portunus trituberculatus TaxID=210409 RepID=UPI001E1CE8AD|nr:uncharacterized protein LOC123500719 [Portunus trituberculatus]